MTPGRVPSGCDSDSDTGQDLGEDCSSSTRSGNDPATAVGSPLPERARALLAELVEFDSTSGSAGEVNALLFVAEWLRQNSPGNVTVASPNGSPTALIVRPPATDSRPLLLFSAHVDVVPVGDRAAWTHDPFSAEVVEDRVFGRGTSDMKSGLAAAMVAVAELLSEGAPVALAVSTGEEVGCRGAIDAATLLSGHPVEAVIVPESTLNQVVLGHRGALWLSVTTRGLAAHGSTPERGLNAIALAANLVGRLSEIPLLRHPELGRESVNVGTIRAGAVPNIVPDRCELGIDIRVVDANTSRLVNWWVAQPEVAEVEVDLDLAAVWTSPDHPWVSGLDAPVSLRPASYFTDLSVLMPHLPPGTPVVIWGPGDPDLVHTVDESVGLAELNSALASYLRVGRRECGSAR